jgi:hypothetical protein
MGKIAETVRAVLVKLASNRKDVMLLATRQRAKFEGWLKFELAAALASQVDIRNVTLEAPYSTQGRADLSFEANGATWYIEIKTTNTNWRAPGLEDKTRPVTRNVDGIITDIAKLREACPPSKGLAVFAVFPVPTRIWEGDREELLFHLRRIEDECKLTANILIDNASFVRLDEHFGVAFFVLEAA